MDNDIIILTTSIGNLDTLQPLVNLCHGIPPSEVSVHLTNCDFDKSTFVGKKISVKVGIYCDQILSCLNTFPCVLDPRHVEFLSTNITMAVHSLQMLENVTSLHCVLNNSTSLMEFTKLMTFIQEKISAINEFTISDFTNDKHSIMDCSIPAITCRRMKIITSRFTSLFNCAYSKLQSLHINAVTSNSRLKFDSELSKIINHNCKSLLDLQMSGVAVERSGCKLLQETFEKCDTLVVLKLNMANNGTLGSARLHEIFCSIQCLPNLEYLHVSDTINVFGEDLLALHKLLCQGMPKLKHCYLSFCRLVIYFTLMGDTRYQPIQELLAVLLCGKYPSPDCHTVAFGWRNNHVIYAWLAGLRCDVKFG